MVLAAEAQNVANTSDFYTAEVNFNSDLLTEDELLGWLDDTVGFDSEDAAPLLGGHDLEVRSTRTSVPLRPAQASAARVCRLTTSSSAQGRVRGGGVPQFHSGGVLDAFAKSVPPPRLPSGDMSGFGGLLPSPEWLAYPQHANPPLPSGPPRWDLASATSQPIAAPPQSTAYQSQYPASLPHGVDAALYPAAASRAGALAP